MSTKTPSVQDDLAFMRALVDGGGGLVPIAFGETYVAAGLIYGLQILIQSSQALGLPALPPQAELVAGVLPTIIFVPVLAWIIWRNRRAGQGGSTSRAVGATFGCIGLANLALICVIGSVAYRQKSLETWLIYPCVVFVLQGAAWLVSCALRKRAWQGLVGVGWFAAAMGMALSIGSIQQYAIVAGLSMLLLMVIPGAVMIRLARRSA
jgi:hypothetical protein